MLVTRCMSSHMMTGLLTWRNPEGSEEEWLGRYQVPGTRSRWKQLVVCAFTEIGLGILATTAAVETVVYATLALTSLILYPVTDKPYKFFVKLLQSSSFTVLWGVADMFVYNPFFANVMTRESFARYWVAQVFSRSRSDTIFRLEDRLNVADWEQQLLGQQSVANGMIGPIIEVGRATQALIDQGARFIVDDVLAGFEASSPPKDDEVITLFKEMDPSVYMLVLAKAVLIYVAGAKKGDEIPHFFKEETQHRILTLRQELNDAEVLGRLQDLTQDLTQFESVPADAATQSAFNKLRSAASGELQGGLLITGCWKKASEELSPPVNLSYSE